MFDQQIKVKLKERVTLEWLGLALGDRKLGSQIKATSEDSMRGTAPRYIPSGSVGTIIHVHQESGLTKVDFGDYKCWVGQESLSWCLSWGSMVCNSCKQRWDCYTK